MMWERVLLQWQGCRILFPGPKVKALIGHGDERARLESSCRPGAWPTRLGFFFSDLYFPWLSGMAMCLLSTQFIFSSVARTCPTLCDPMDCSTPDLPAHHQLPEFTQTHVHWVGDAMQPPHLLLFPSPPAFDLSQHQGLFQWVSSLASGGQSIGVSASASVLPVNIQDWFPLVYFRRGYWQNWSSFKVV